MHCLRTSTVNDLWLLNAAVMLSVTLVKVSAELELATPERKRWIVQTERFSDAGDRVYPEPAATLAETERGMALLKKLVERTDTSTAALPCRYDEGPRGRLPGSPHRILSLRPTPTRPAPP